MTLNATEILLAAMAAVSAIFGTGYWAFRSQKAKSEAEIRKAEIEFEEQISTAKKATSEDIDKRFKELQVESLKNQLEYQRELSATVTRLQSTVMEQQQTIAHQDTRIQKLVDENERKEKQIIKLVRESRHHSSHVDECEKQLAATRDELKSMREALKTA